jgi:DNA-binding HxlR family transcriptional regulator
VKKRCPTSCPIVYALDIFGDKWSLVILRDILLGGKRHFREFLRSEEKIATNILSNRLASLVREEMLTREDDATNKSAALYKPTEKALKLQPMFIELMRWGLVYNPNADTTGPLAQRLLNDQNKRNRRSAKK